MAESSGLPRLLKSISKAAYGFRRGSVLAIFCVNGREDSPEWVHQDNAKTMSYLLGDAGCEELSEEDGRVRFVYGADFSRIVVDLASIGCRLDPKDGVGLVRKIGCDIAVNMWHRGKIFGDWIYTTDGDAEVPDDYFASVADIGAEVVALALRYEHVPVQSNSPETTGDLPLWAVQDAIRFYERFLKYYEQGLALAKSPYAFQTVGSSMAFRFCAYIAVRGFPKKNAGEDFYLLNKLAKVGKVASKGGKPIMLSGRVSTRVPFGTGASVKKIAEELSLGKPFSVYDPRTFEVLRILLAEMDSFGMHRDLEKMERSLARVIDEKFGDEITRVFFTIFAASGWALAATQMMSRCKTSDNLRRQIDIWMDGFKTLKWVHQIREKIFPEIPIASLQDFDELGSSFRI